MNDQIETIVNIELKKLVPFRDHPFQVRDDDEMRMLTESVSSVGVLVPAIVRPIEDGQYEIIAGHRRHYASGIAGLSTIPCIVRNVDRDTATVMMVDTPEQWHQLEYGLEQRLDFKVFANPAYSAEQMEALQCALVAESRGYVSRDDIIQISDPAMAPDVMKKTLYAAFKEHQAEQFAVKEDAGLQENGLYRYYSTQRPIAPGTFPKGDNAPVTVENFDDRIPVENGQMQAWGYLEYLKPLTAKQQSDYELKPAGTACDKMASQKIEKRKSVLADLRAKQAQVEQSKKSEQSHVKHKEMEQE